MRASLDPPKEHWNELYVQNDISYGKRTLRVDGEIVLACAASIAKKLLHGLHQRLFVPDLIGTTRVAAMPAYCIL